MLLNSPQEVGWLDNGSFLPVDRKDGHSMASCFGEQREMRGLKDASKLLEYFYSTHCRGGLAR